MFFKGYVETKDKKCIEKFKGRTDFKTYEQVQSLPEFAGILAPETILIDVDDFESSEILFKIVNKFNLKCRVYQTTRGKHFLFKNSGVVSCKTATNLACGLKADIKLGSRNSYSILKFNGQERKILLDCKEEDVSDLPKWLHPIKADLPFLNMEAGDGRNNAFFTYELTLQSNDFSVEEARQCIRIINEFVISDPLSEHELEVILRDEAFKKPIFFKGTTFLHDKFATYIKNNNRIIKINGQLHLYKDGIYVSGQDELEAVMIQHISSLSRAKRSEVLAYLNILIMDNTEMAAPNLIAFRNGIYDLNTGKLKPFNPETVLTNRIPWDFNPAAYSEIADKTLDKIACFDPKIRKILEECVGSCFYRSNTLGGGKAFILTGEGSNGKSTFLTMIQRMLGEGNISSLDLKELDAKFQNAELFGKLANIGDDISDEFIVNASVFKKLVTGNRIQVQRKGERPFEFNNYSKMLFSANNIPRIKDKTGAVLRRLLIVPFNARFSSDDADYDPEITYKMQSQETMEYMIQIGLAALKEVLEKKVFTESEKVKAEVDEYEEMNNPVKAFLHDCEDNDIQILNESVKVVFEKYSVFCTMNGFQAVSQTECTKQIRRLCGYDTKQVRVGKNRERVYVESETHS